MTRLLNFIIVFILYFFTINGIVAAQVRTINLPPKAKSMINSWGIVTTYYPTISYNVNVSVAPVNISGSLLGGIISGIEAGTEELSKESAIGLRGGLGLSAYLKNWDFNNIFQQTLYKEFIKYQPDSKVQLFKDIFYEELNEDSLPKSVQNCDVILDIHINDYGLESKSTKGFSIFLSAILELMWTKNRKIIASHTIRFDMDYLKIWQRRIYNLYVKNQAKVKREELKPGEEFNYLEFKKTFPPPSYIISLPFSVRFMNEYLENDAYMLKKQLKLTAIEVSRAMIEFLQLGGNKVLQSTLAEYLIRPSN